MGPPAFIALAPLAGGRYRPAMADTIPARLQKRARQQPQSPAYRWKEGGAWQTANYETYAREVRTAARALVALGFSEGDRTCILGFNRPEWCVFDHATMAAGGAPAGIYTTSSAEETAWIARHAGARIMLVENAAQFAKVVSRLDAMPLLAHVVLMRGASVDHPKALTWEAFLARADEVPESLVDRRIEALRADQPATLIYTSGTTGLPKAVMLSHDNLAWTAGQIREVLELGDGEVVLSYLPLSHIAEQIFTLHGPATFGFCVYFAESLEKLPDNLKEARPTVFFGVPRVWEKFHAGVVGKLAKATGLKKLLADRALAVGAAVARLRMHDRTPGPLLALQHRVLDRLVLAKVRAALGFDRTHVCVSGAAPVSGEVLEFFWKLGLTLLEVYGQSEGSGPTSITRSRRTFPGTVGEPFPGVDIKLADDAEILLRGRNVFLGYYADEAATRECLHDGWLSSGDLGAFDKDGNLTITGRKKELIITAGGKNVSPRWIESALKEHPLIIEAVTVGDRRRFLSALLVLDPERAQALGDEAPAEVQRIVDLVNERLSQVEHVRKFVVLPRALTLEHGELTPTMKVRRAKVATNWAKEIESMYEGDAA